MEIEKFRQQQQEEQKQEQKSGIIVKVTEVKKLHKVNRFMRTLLLCLVVIATREKKEPFIHEPVRDVLINKFVWKRWTTKFPVLFEVEDESESCVCSNGATSFQIYSI